MDRIDSFYITATETLIEADAYIDRLVGDEVVGLFMPGLAGPGYTLRAIEAARVLVDRVGQEAGLPVGAGVHAGVAFVGTVEGTAGVGRDIAAVGDPVNTTSRLASAAKAGQVLIREDAIKSSGFDPRGLEVRHLDLKGKSEPLTVHVMGTRGASQDPTTRVAVVRGPLPMSRAVAQGLEASPVP